MEHGKKVSSEPVGSQEAMLQLLETFYYLEPSLHDRMHGFHVDDAIYGGSTAPPG